MAPKVTLLPDSPCRALLFDMDGVLIDSNPVHRETWIAYNRRYGVETTQSMIDAMYGMRNDQIIRGWLGEHLTEAEVFAHGAAKEALYRDLIRPRVHQMLVPGVRRFLEGAAGFGLAVATNAERANLELVLGESGLASFFRVAVDGHQVSRPKPDPEIYLKAARLLGVEPASCVVFEDSLAGVEAGRAAGMPVVGITTTHGELPGAEILIRDFEDPALAAWLAARA